MFFFIKLTLKFTNFREYVLNKNLSISIQYYRPIDLKMCRNFVMALYVYNYIAYIFIYFS